MRRCAPLLCLLLSYWAISLNHLTIVPQVYEDEPWQASTGWKLATRGVFGSDMFAGFYGMERRYYGYMPLHPMFLAAIFRAAGVGLFQARFEPVAFGLLTLALTYSLACRLFREARVGLLAILFLISVRLTGLSYVQVTGILFLDMARLARYDMVVPVFGLASLHAYLSARDAARGRERWYFLAGILSGLSGLAHLYGLFWLPVLLLLTIWDGRSGFPEGPRPQVYSVLRAPFGSGLRYARYVLLGCALPWLPYIAYVLGDLYDWRGQTRGYGDRFDLLNPRWYLDNLLREPGRYAPGLGPTGRAVALRVGFWSAVIVLPSSLGALAWRGWRYGDRAARAVVVPAIVIPLLFAVLLHLKLINYLVTVAPLGAIAAAWGGVTCWTWLPSGARRSGWARAALTAFLLAVVAEGAGRIAALHAAAATTTPYYDYIHRIRRYLPPNARVLGLHRYWFGLEDFDYRSFFVPVSWTDRRYEPRPLPFEAGLELVAPNVILIDSRMREALRFNASAGGGDGISAGFYRWLSGHDGHLIGRVEDPTYGLMEIYRVNP